MFRFKRVGKVFCFLLMVSLLMTFFTKSNVGSLKADASVSNVHTPYPITFYVPETIYLTPSVNPAYEFKYFVDCNIDGSLGTAKRNDTTGTVYFYCEGATSCSIICNGAAVVLGQTVGTNSINTECTGGVLSTGVTAGTSRTISWTVTYTVNGDTRTATAYSVCWSPFYEPIGAAAYFHNNDGIGGDVRALFSSLAWLSGVHSIISPSTNQFRMTSANYVAPLLNQLTPPSGGQDAHDWLNDTDSGVYYVSREDGTNYQAMSLLSALGLITVDTSRYSNFNQIPNLSVGYMATNTDRNDSWYKWYVSNYTGQTQYLANENHTNNDSNYRLNEIYNLPGIVLLSGTGVSHGIKYNADMFSQPVAGVNQLRFKACGYIANDGEDCLQAFYCLVNVIQTDKSILREHLRYYINLGLQASDYTTASWSAFSNALVEAATRLGDVESSNVDLTALNNAYNSLVKSTYTATITHKLPCQSGVTGLVNSIATADSADGFNDGYITITESLTFDSSDTVSFSPNNYTGYTISSATGSTTSVSAQSWQNRRSDINVIYLYTANQYAVALNYGSDSVGGYGHQLYTSTYDISSLSVRFNFTYGSGNLPEPTMTGWSFGGWYSSPGFTTRILDTTIMTQSTPHTIYAKWASYFSGGHGYKSGNIVNGTTLNYDDMFLISTITDLDRIDQYDSIYSYSTSNGFSYKQTANLTLN